MRRVHLAFDLLFCLVSKPAFGLYVEVTVQADGFKELETSIEHQSELLCAFGCQGKNGSCSAFRFDPVARTCHLGGLEPSAMYLRKGTGIDVKASANRPPEVDERVFLVGGVGGTNTQSTYNPFGYPNPTLPLRDQSFPYRPLAAYVQEGILVCGGQDVGAGAVTNTKRCQHFTLMDADWVEYPEMLREHERGKAIEIGGDFWVTGGLDQGLVTDKTEYLTGRVWSDGPLLPAATESHNLVKIGPKEAFFLAHLGADNAKAWTIDWESKTWTPKSAMPASFERYYFAMGLLVYENGERNLIVAGGSRHANRTGQYHHSVRYHVDSDTWFAKADHYLHPFIMDPVMFNLGKDLYIVGGVDDTGGVVHRVYQATEINMSSRSGASTPMYGMAAVTFNPPRGLG